MAIKSFSVLKHGQRQSGGPLLRSGKRAPLAGAAHVLQQEVAGYRVARGGTWPELVPDRPPDRSLQELLQGLEQRVVALSADISRLLQSPGLILQAPDEAAIQAKLPSMDEQQSAVAWQIDQNARLRTEFLAQCALYSSKQVADVLGSTARNRAAMASHLKDKGKIFCIRWHAQDWFPQFQFDLQGRRYYPEVAEVIQARSRDCLAGWPLALWFNAANEWLDGQTPLVVWNNNNRRAVVDAAVQARDVFDA